MLIVNKVLVLLTLMVTIFFSVFCLAQNPKYDLSEKIILKEIIYPYKANRARVKKIVTSISKLKLCLSNRDIQIILGDPDDLFPNSPGKVKDNRGGYYWRYFIAAEHQSRVNRYIQLYFNKEEKLAEFKVINIDDTIKSSVKKGAMSYICNKYKVSSKRRSRIIKGFKKIGLCTRDKEIRKLIGGSDYLVDTYSRGKFSQHIAFIRKYVLEAKVVKGEMKNIGVLVTYIHGRAMSITPDKSVAIKKRGPLKRVSLSQINKLCKGK